MDGKILENDNAIIFNNRGFPRLNPINNHFSITDILIISPSLVQRVLWST